MAVEPAFTTRPLYTGMPATDRILEINVVGVQRAIRLGGACRDDYGRIVIQHDAGRIVKLQRAAWESFHAAELNLGFAIITTGTWRSCAYQTELHRMDPARFADPLKSLHPRGLAVDVSTAQEAAKKDRIRRALEARGWHQSRPDDEPWHYSYGGLG